MRRLGLLFVVALAAGGCAPTIPFHFAETAETLKAKEVSLTVAAGGGSGRDINACCGGGAARVRVGVGHQMEVGAEVSVIGGKDLVAPAGKVSFKFAPVRWFALVAGVGGSGQVDLSPKGGGSPLYLGADLAGIFSTDPLAELVRFYGGARFTFALPVTNRFYENVPTQGFVVPAGVSIGHDTWHFFVEGGLTGGWSEVADHGAVARFDWIGGYGALAFSETWR